MDVHVHVPGLDLRDQCIERLARQRSHQVAGVELALDLEAQRAPLPPPQGDGAAGGVVSTALDLARFDIALDRGDLITAESRSAMMTPTRLTDGETAPYGLGWYVKEHADEHVEA